MTPQPAPAPGARKQTIADGFAGMLNALIDPPAAARKITAPFSWLWPLLILGFGGMYVALQMMPIMLPVMRATVLNEIPAEQRDVAFSRMAMGIRVMAYLNPVTMAVLLLVLAGLVYALTTMSAKEARFRDIFALLASCFLIIGLQGVAGWIVLHARARDIQSVQELSPSFGVDMFLTDLKGPLFAIVNFFSLFEIWFMSMFVLGLAALLRIRKGQAFWLATPVWLLPLLFRIVGSLFSKS